MYDIDSHQFVLWSDTIPAFNPPAHQGIPNNIFVHTPYTMVSLIFEKKKNVLYFILKGIIKFDKFNDRK